VPRGSAAQRLTQIVLTTLGAGLVVLMFFFLITAFFEGRQSRQTLGRPKATGS
jgi:Na+-transporting methylmalonyl-CoA/oxaloacetate decarboxylase gamma subunit